MARWPTHPWTSLTPHACRLGESPFWHPQERRLYWVDIAARQLHRFEPATQELQSWTLHEEPGCVAPARSGGWVLALRGGIHRAREWGGALERLHEAPYDAATTRFNDGKADPHGRLWASTYFEPKSHPGAALYRLSRGAGWALTRMAGDATTGNGLAWSPDGRTLYWSDTQSHEVRAFDVDPASGELANGRVFHRFASKPAGWRPGDPGYGGRPDGAAVDTRGHYWCAMYEGGRIVELSPQGELRQSIELPVPCPTMPCFGGDDLRTLYVTSAGDRPAAERERWPLSGQVLAMPVDVPGLPVNFFID